MLDGDHKALVDAALPVCARYGLVDLRSVFGARRNGRPDH